MQGGVTHKRGKVFEFMGIEGHNIAATGCGLKIYFRRIYPLLWSDSDRQVTCKRVGCLRRQPRRAGRKA